MNDRKLLFLLLFLIFCASSGESFECLFAFHLFFRSWYFYLNNWWWWLLTKYVIFQIVEPNNLSDTLTHLERLAFVVGAFVRLNVDFEPVVALVGGPADASFFEILVQPFKEMVQVLLHHFIESQQLRLLLLPVLYADHHHYHHCWSKTYLC